MKQIAYVVGFYVLLAVEPALAQTWLEEVTAARKADEAQEREVGLNSTDLLAGTHYDLREMSDEGLGPAGFAGARPAYSGRRARRVQDLLDGVAGLHRLSVALRSFRFAPLDEPWTQRDVRDRSKKLEDVARELFRSMTGNSPETFQYDRARFAVRRLDEQLAMTGVLAARVRMQVLETFETGVIDVASQKSIASRLNILWELGRYLQLSR